MSKIQCQSCGCEWNIPDSMHLQLDKCPFCNQSLKKREIQFATSIQDALNEISLQFGSETLNDGKKTLAFFTDIAPSLKRERRIISCFVNCNGHTELYNVRHETKDNQKIAFEKVVHQMVEEWYIAEQAARMVCQAYLDAIAAQSLTDTHHPSSSVAEKGPKNTICSSDEDDYSLHIDSRSDCIVRLSGVNVGDIISFGSYQPENDNIGNHPIEWQVLEKESAHLLVISRYALFCLPYNDNLHDVTWENCTLRTWLNRTFYNTAFSPLEQSLIPSVAVPAHINPDISWKDQGRSTTDKVFLLSIVEAKEYFSSDRARQCVCTRYCYEQGAYKGGDGNCMWWLRTSGSSGGVLSAVVNCDGSVFSHGTHVNHRNITVRPALWIDLES